MSCSCADSEHGSCTLGYSLHLCEGSVGIVCGFVGFYFNPVDVGFKAPSASTDLSGTVQGSSFCSSFCKPGECVTHLVTRASFSV